MNDLEKRAHDLAIIYIKSEIEQGKLKVDNLNDFVVHYKTLCNDLKYELNPS